MPLLHPSAPSSDATSQAGPARVPPLAALPVGVVAAWIVAVAAGLGGAHAGTVSNVGQALAAGIAAVLVLARARRASGDTRRFWALVGAGTGLWSIAQVVWTLLESMQGEPPFPSLADAGFVGCALLLIGALVSIARGGVGHAARARAVLDGLLIAGSLLLVAWVLVLGRVVEAQGDSRLAQAVSLAYPVLDIVLLTMLGFTQVRRRRAAIAGAPFALLSAGLAAFAVADTAFTWMNATGAYTSASLLPNGGWVLGFSLLALASLDDRPLEAVDEVGLEPATTAFAPYVALAVAVGTATVAYVVRGDRDTTLFAIESALSASVLLRQLLAVLENRALTRTLERRVDERTAELSRHEQRFRALVLHASDVITVVDEGGTVLFQSDSIRRAFGHRAADVVGQPVCSLMAEPDQCHLREAIANARRSPGRPLVHDSTLRCADGTVRDVVVTITSMLADPAVRALVLNVRDVTEERGLERQLRHQAFHDPLTALANRALFLDRLEHALARPGDATVHVLFLDLDRFKEVNDTLGHAAGDALLVAVARRLAAGLRPDDTLARLGGDEFAVLLERGDATDAEAAAWRLLTGFDEPFAGAGGEPQRIRASIGVAGGGSSDDAGTLLRNADLAMYRAKAQRLGCVVYEASMHRDLVERISAQRDLARALREDELFLEYQPTVSLLDGRATGFEALVRWRHPTLGRLGPAAFVPAAEESGMIDELGRWVLRNACRQLARWRADDRHDVIVHVNVAAAELRDPGFADRVIATLHEEGVPPHALVLEITETGLMQDPERCAVALAQLRDLGVRIAIDDFGAGYSSLSYVRALPVDILKIDRTFVASIDADPRNRQIVEAITALAASLRIETIAEGVEREDELEAVRALGCDLAQGFLVGRPLAAEPAGRIAAAVASATGEPATEGIA